jgi:hypothetical protein
MTFNKRWLIFAFIVLAFLSIGGYFAASARTFAIGFPLDDAWIHQTYARNLWQEQTWSFIPDVPSAGSTSPLWSILLAIGYGLGLDKNWAYLMGLLLLLTLSGLCVIWLRARQRNSNRYVWLVGALILIEWHMVWAAASGMEILLSAVFAVLVFFWLEAKLGYPALLGLTIGISVWVRPDLILLVLPVGWSWFWQYKPDWRKLIVYILALGAGVAIGLVPYGLFNLYIGDTLLPNTFYAKQAEYAILVKGGLLRRILDQFLVPLVGIGVVLLPGVIYSSYKSVHERELYRLASILWVIMVMVLYALRLPVTYQHGRYLMPAIPVWTVIGFEGLMLWVHPGSDNMLRRIISRAWIMVLVLVGVIFWVLGARAYGRDVAIIETEMVATSKWIASNTPQDSLIAAHDIGALGYFGERQILDLAGLISPEVIPIIRDEAELQDFLILNNADYLMTFPGWYPELVEGKRVIYSTQSSFSPEAGGENMEVFALE